MTGKGTWDRLEANDLGILGRTADLLDPPEAEWAGNAPGWIDAKLHEFVWSKQREVLASVRDNRYTAVRSAHSTGKSHIASRAVAHWIDSHPVDEVFVVTTAPTSSQVKAILWRYIKAAHRKGDLPGYITDAEVPEWKMGVPATPGQPNGRDSSILVGWGRKPQDLVSAEEAATAFQGIHARFVLVVLDEAGGIPEWLWNAVDTLVTSPTNRVLAIGNPDDPASHFAKVCKAGSGWNVIGISAFDTPAFTGEPVPEDLLDLLVSPEWVMERKRRWGEESMLYTSKVLGEFPDVSEDTLIPPRWLNAAIARDLSEEAAVGGQYGWDIARTGKDETVGYRNRGGVVRLVYSKRTQDLDKTTGAIAGRLNLHKGSVPAVIDATGIGAGVFDFLAADGQPVHAFYGAERPADRQHFVNRRAEAYWNLREDFRLGLIDIDPEDEDLHAQLGNIKWHLDRKGKIQIESKEDMLKRGVPSPDRADAVMYSTAVTPAVWDLEDLNAGTTAGITDDLLERAMC